MKSARSLGDIRRRVLMEVIPVSAVNVKRGYEKRAGKLVQATKYCDDFFEAMTTGTGYASEEEAIQKLAPIAGWFIGWAARKFAIMVIKALWRHWHSDVA